MQKYNLLFLIGFLCLALNGCASHSGRLSDTEPEPAAAMPPVVHAIDRASGVALQALAHLGTPYRVSGLSPQTGFDCSGLVAYVLSLIHISEPTRLGMISYAVFC